MAGSPTSESEKIGDAITSLDLIPPHIQRNEDFSARIIGIRKQLQLLGSKVGNPDYEATKSHTQGLLDALFDDLEKIQKIDTALATLYAIPSEIQSNPLFSERIVTVRGKLEGLKKEVEKPDYDTQKKEVQTSLTKLLDDIDTYKLDTLSKYYLIDLWESLLEEVKKIPSIISAFDEIRKLIDEVRRDISLYDAKKNKINEACNHLYEKLIPEVLEQFAFIETNRKHIEDIKSKAPDMSSDPRVADCIRRLSSALITLQSTLGTDDYPAEAQKVNEIIADLQLAEGEFTVLSEREKTFEKLKAEAQKYIDDVEASKDLYAFFGIKQGKIDTLSTTMAQMMQEGGLTAADIVGFYGRFGKSEEKRVSTEDWNAWNEKIRSQNPSGKVERGGKPVQGSMPKEMQDALRSELLGPNTLTMMRTASEQYQREYSAYLKHENTNDTLVKFGIEEDQWVDWFNKKAGVKLDAQEARIVFLKAYTDFLGNVIKRSGNPSAMDQGLTDLFKKIDPREWPFYGKIAGAIGGAVLAVFSVHFLNEVAKKTSKNSAESFVNALGFTWNTAVNEILPNPNRYESMSHTLTDTYRTYVEGTVKFIRARMALREGETITFRGQNYGPLTEGEGNARIDAIYTAVASASGRNQLKNVGAEFTGNLRLSRYLQHIAQAPGGWQGAIVSPMRIGNERNGGRKLRGNALRAAIILSTIPAGNLLPLVAMPDFRRTVFGAPIRAFGGFRTASGERMPLWDEGKGDTAVKEIGRALNNDPEIANYTCSEAEIKEALALVESFVNSGLSTVPNRYTERQAYDLIENALRSRGPRLSRVELRIYTLQAIYLLKGEAGHVDKNTTQNFLATIRDNRLGFEQTRINQLNEHFERVAHHHAHPYGPHELQLVILELEQFVDSHSIEQYDRNARPGDTPERTNFRIYDPTSRGFCDVAELQRILEEEARWLENQPHSPDLRERFAERVLDRIDNRVLDTAPGFSLHEHFDELFTYDVLRRTGLIDIQNRINSGDIATPEELTNALNPINIPSQFRAQAESMLVEELDRHLDDSKHTINSDVFFETAVDADAAKASLSAVLRDPIHRGAIQILGGRPGDPFANMYIYHALSGGWRIDSARVDAYVNDRWNRWINAQISSLDAEFSGSPLDFSITRHVERARKILDKCTRDQARRLANTLYGSLQTIASNSTETIPRRRAAIELLKDPTLIANHVDGIRTAIDQLAKDQEADIKRLETGEAKNNLRARLEIRIASLEQKMHDDATKSGDIIAEFDQIVADCGIYSDLNTEFSKRLAKFWIQELKTIVDSESTDITRESRESALNILEATTQISANISGTDRSALTAYIKSERGKLAQAKIDGELAPLRQRITDSVLDPTIEGDLAIMLQRLSGGEKFDIRRRLVSDYANELMALCGRDTTLPKNRDTAIKRLRKLLSSDSLTVDDKEKIELFIDTTNISLVQKEVDACIESMTNPLEVNGDILKGIFDRCNREQKKQLRDKYIEALKGFIESPSTSPKERRIAINTLRSTQLKFLFVGLSAGEQGALNNYCDEQLPIVDAEIREIQRRNERSQIVSGIVQTALNGKTQLKDKIDALIRLAQDYGNSQLTPGEKRIIREFFPEGRTTEDTEVHLTGCIHRLFYPEKGNTTDIYRAHQELIAANRSLTYINTQLASIGITRVGEEVNESIITGRR